MFDDYATTVSKTKYEVKHGKILKILTPKQMLQILSIHLAQVKSNTSKNLLNKTRQIIYSLYQEKEITKNNFNIIMNSIKL